MVTAQWIIEQFEQWAPESTAEEWDNVGLLIGDAAQPVHKILVALDATEEVIKEAVTGGFDFIITHHPIVYNPIKSITTGDRTGRKIISLIKNGIGCFCAHTNLDKAEGGVNDCLAEKIGLTNLTPLEEESGLGRVGELPDKITLSYLAGRVKTALGLDTIRMAGDPKKQIKKIAICGGDGSGSRYINAAIAKNCDVYITGDLRYHIVQESMEQNLAFLDITHYAGEISIVDAVVARLSADVEIAASKINGQVFNSM
ncbi:MAG: Nif3-like dinuclear metal center hexameric protein [Defluviitaleaceae bacterium]|nr:Nif3-like dinuclear metal center hexameric protein [Defluviitaleaceae bacterium]